MSESENSRATSEQHLGDRLTATGEFYRSNQHLGDRLSALVDGELGHEVRERVLAHLATCAKCKAEADAQRRLRNVFSEPAPPPPSEGFLARLQGLPGGGDPHGGGSPLGGGGFGGLSGRRDATDIFGVKRGERFEFGYVPPSPHAASDHGSRVHLKGRNSRLGQILAFWLRKMWAFQLGSKRRFRLAESEVDRCDLSPAELDNQALSAVSESTGTVFTTLDQLFRALGPPLDDLHGLDQTPRSDGGRQL